MKQTDAQRELCVQLKSKGMNIKEISERLGLTERQVKTRLYEHGKNRKDEVVAEQQVQDNFKNDLDDFFGGLTDNSLYNSAQADEKREQIQRYIHGKYIGLPVKVLDLSDIHIPFADYKSIANILNTHRDADIVVIDGDLLDLYAVSKYAKDKEVALRREMEEGRSLLEFISARFNDVIVVEGNHERRLKHFVKNMIPTDMQFLFPDDILQMVASGDVLKKSPIHNVHIVGSWWIKLFDAIFAHPDNYSNANLKTVQNTSEHFLLKKGIHHRMCIVGHTHQAGWMVAGGVKLMETGCLCQEMDYHNGASFTRHRWTKAHAVAYFDKNGNVDFQESTVILL